MTAEFLATALDARRASLHFFCSAMRDMRRHRWSLRLAFHHSLCEPLDPLEICIALCFGPHCLHVSRQFSP